MSVFTKDLPHYIKFSQSRDHFLAGWRSLLNRYLPHRPDRLVDILDTLNPFLQIRKAQQSGSDLQPVFTLDLTKHLKSIIPSPNRVHEHIDHHFQHCGLEGILLTRPEYQLVPIGVSCIIVDIAECTKQRLCQLLDVCTRELLVPHRLRLAQEGAQSNQMVERQVSRTNSGRVEHLQNLFEAARQPKFIESVHNYLRSRKELCSWSSEGRHRCC